MASEEAGRLDVPRQRSPQQSAHQPQPAPSSRPERAIQLGCLSASQKNNVEEQELVTNGRDLSENSLGAEDGRVRSSKACSLPHRRHALLVVPSIGGLLVLIAVALLRVIPVDLFPRLADLLDHHEAVVLLDDPLDL